jgi:hypothetical protein
MLEHVRNEELVHGTLRERQGPFAKRLEVRDDVHAGPRVAIEVQPSFQDVAAATDIEPNRLFRAHR